MKIPGEAVITGHFLVVEYMEPDGNFYLKSECHGTGGEELSLGKTLELIEYGKAHALSHVTAQALSGYFILTDDDDEDGFVEYGEEE